MAKTFLNRPYSYSQYWNWSSQLRLTWGVFSNAKDLFLFIVFPPREQCSPEAPAVAVSASYLSLKCRLLLFDKTMEKDYFISVRICT